MDRLSSIIVGVDFTPASHDALAQAQRIGAWNRAKVQAVHVIDTLVLVELQESLSPMVVEMERSLIEDAKSAWKQFAADVPGAASLPFDVAVNNPMIELTRRCRDANADLLVLGSHGMAHSHGVGTLAGQLVRRGPTRVLLVAPGATGPYKTIIVGVDFSPTSRVALEQAMRLAAEDGSQVHVMHVFRPPWKGLMFKPSNVDASPAAQAKYRDQLRAKLEAFSRPGDPQVKWTSPRFELIENTSHGAGIVEYAKAARADLVVLGTRGKSNLREVLLGSTAERVLRQVHCSILAVKGE